MNASRHLGGLPPSRLLDTDDEVLEARRLQAQEYLRVGYVTAEAVGPEATITERFDPWIPYSRYFGAFGPDGALHATCRVISSEAPWPLPTLQLPGIDRAVRAELEDLPPGRLGEVSALVRRPDGSPNLVRALLLAVLLDARDRGLTDWVLSVDRLVLRTLRGIDDRPFRIVGELSPAPVRPVYPVRLRVCDVREERFAHGLVPDQVVLP